ncbi:hypothetical protein EDD18DRAFT_1110066 [Armillaria luteobubalina]|uniref:Uncharacterized protein n=1 Tax=Armillaria luteobubalina TaxID=153913 RepID=A0AA39PSG7_9AGAR|nr:hypothetical protein EDD18DRAFT_1110066 [Armillaria luteobubalina]
MAIRWLCRFFSCLLPPPHRPPPLPTQWNSYIDGIERLFFRPGNTSNKDLLTMTTTTAYWTIIRTEGGGLGEWGEGERAGWCEQDGDTEMRAPTANNDGNTRALWGIDTYPNEGSEAPNGSSTAPLPSPPLAPPLPAQHHPLPPSLGHPETPYPCISHSLSGGTQLWVPFCLQTPLWPDAHPSSRRLPKMTYSASYSTADDAMTGASIADTTTDLMHPTRPVRSNYRAHHCRPPPRPSSPSPTSPRAPRAPTSRHLPLFEWGNIAVRPVLPTDPTVTCRPPMTPPPTLYDIPPALQGSPLPQNLTTPVFDNGKCNGNAVAPSSNPACRTLPPAIIAAHERAMIPITSNDCVSRRRTCLRPEVHHAQPFRSVYCPFRYCRSCQFDYALFWYAESSFFWCPMVGVVPVEQAGQREFRLQ